MTEQNLQHSNQPHANGKKGVLLPMLLIGTLSMLFAEIFSGSSQAWFATGWGLLMTFPLYLSHVLFFLFIALKLKKISLPQLYVFGAIFSLYEAWITKVLWAGYGDTGPMLGTVAGIGISEFPMLVFFWHPVMAFILPILIFEILTGQVFEAHTSILRKSARKTKLVILFLILISAFIVNGNGYNLLSANLSLIGTLFIVSGLYYSVKSSNIKVFEFSKISFAMVTMYLLLLYTGTFLLLHPGRIPHSLVPFISIIIFYALFIFIIRRSKKVETEFVQLNKEHYTIGDLKKFALITIVAVNVVAVVPVISMYIFSFTYFAIALTGTILFATVVYKILKQNSPIKKIPERGQLLSVTAIITNKNNEVLLQHRDNKAPTSPNVWALWGGRMEQGEEPLDAITRELKEELTIDVSKDSLTLFRAYHAGYFENNWEGYAFRTEDRGNFTYDLKEGDDLKFFSLEEIKNLDDMDPNSKLVVLEYFETVKEK